MKKAFIIIFKIIMILIVLYIILFLIGRYGWKLFGFKMCDSSCYVNNVYVTDLSVTITGGTLNSSLAYAGYTYKVKDGVLYAGVKQNLFLGFDRTGDFNFTINVDTAGINSIRFVNGKNIDISDEVWNLGRDMKYMEKISSIKLYKSIQTSDNTDYKSAILNKEFEYADENLLIRMRYPVFNIKLHQTKGGGYLGVASLENGKKLYLDIDRHFDYYKIINKSGFYDY
ncbi:MAG: hypothetical protein Q8882_05550 [Bacillota bacterium]|nr:hypothetical protein [Bacillota bacterium]